MATRPVLVGLLEGGAITAGREDASDPTSYLAAIDEIQGRGDDVLVAELDGEVVGVCELILFRRLQHRGGRCAELESVHVRSDLRGRGIGGKLLEAAVTRARQAGCYRVQLLSNTVRTDAHRFYERHAFVASHVGFKRALDG